MADAAPAWDSNESGYEVEQQATQLTQTLKYDPIFANRTKAANNEVEVEQLEESAVGSSVTQNSSDVDLEHAGAIPQVPTRHQTNTLVLAASRNKIVTAKLLESDLEKGIVGWESQDDPEMPRNFPLRKKILLLSLVCSMTFISPLASSMFAPGVGIMAEEFHNSIVLLDSFCVSVFVLGFGVCNPF